MSEENGDNPMVMRTSLFLLLLICGAPAYSTHPCTSPLILDLNGDGVLTYGVGAGVSFDINADGSPEEIGWTNPYTQEGFLWLDLNRNHFVDHGGELFGTATQLPTGEFARNGFEALAVYDDPSYGGNADGYISDQDLIWPHLRVWVDRNQDGVSQAQEISSLKKWGIVALGLDYVESDRVDGAGNWHRFRGRFLRKVRQLGTELLQEQIMEDIFFAFREAED